MDKIKEIYYHIKGTPTADQINLGSPIQNYVRADVYYDKGGYSYFTYKQTPRAYFMSVSKLGRGKDSCGFWEAHMLFAGDGARFLIEEVTKKSKKKSESAEKYFDENIENFIKQVYPDLELEEEVAK